MQYFANVRIFFNLKMTYKTSEENFKSNSFVLIFNNEFNTNNNFNIDYCLKPDQYALGC